MLSHDAGFNFNFMSRVFDDKMEAAFSYLVFCFTILPEHIAQVTFPFIMKIHQATAVAIAMTSGDALASVDQSNCSAASNMSLSWHPPSKNSINDLGHALNGTEANGFVYTAGQAPTNTSNWCNMPHVTTDNYVKASGDYKLEYVEVIHRHHKRTPYSSNTFPREGYPCECNDEGLFYGGKPLNPYGNDSAATYWSVYTSPSNPLAPSGFNGSCQFPQITRGGLDDSHQHGVDLKAVYGGSLGFIPSEYDANAVSYRVTNNVITSQVASMLIPGMYPSRKDTDTPLLIQPDGIDSLEPSYSCSAASLDSYATGSNSSAWLRHLNASAGLFSRLDTLSGVEPNSTEWHQSFDHYYDNLSARLCHSKPLPCKIGNETDCVSSTEAEEVFRLGQYEYSYLYRDAPESLSYSVASYGIYMAELAQNLRDVMEGKCAGRKYRHNVAHDGSISRLLSILQVDVMYWPGMGAEVVFELYNKAGCHFLRVLLGGQVLVSSHPAFGRMDMVPAAPLLAYIDGLVGVGANKVPALCEA